MFIFNTNYYFDESPVIEGLLLSKINYVTLTIKFENDCFENGNPFVQVDSVVVNKAFNYNGEEIVLLHRDKLEILDNIDANIIEVMCYEYLEDNFNLGE